MSKSNVKQIRKPEHVLRYGKGKECPTLNAVVEQEPQDAVFVYVHVNGEDQVGIEMSRISAASFCIELMRHLGPESKEILLESDYAKERMKK